MRFLTFTIILLASISCSSQPDDRLVAEIYALNLRVEALENVVLDLEAEISRVEKKQRFHEH
jgi:hypothetical protein